MHVPKDAGRGMQLPMTLEGITPEWLSAALSFDDPGVVVKDVAIIQVIRGAATKVRIRVKYGEGTARSLPETLWVKSGFETHHEFVEGVLGVYTREAQVFSDLIPMYDVRTPKSYFAKSQTSPAQAVIILEDLLDRDVRFNVVTEPLTAAEVASGLENLAKQHGQSWEDPRLEKFPYLDFPLRGPIRRVFYDFVEDADKYFKALRGYAVPIALHSPVRLGAGLQSYIAHAASGPSCFLHGDTHVGNTYKEKNGSVCFLDWQTSCKGNWSHDVSSFLVSAMDVEDRRRHEKDLISYYLKHLSEYGGRAPDFANAWDDYRRGCFLGFLAWLGNSDDWQSPVINLATFSRFGYAMLDHDVYAALGV
jgi:Ecdysteroid kinase-like family